MYTSLCRDKTTTPDIPTVRLITAQNWCSVCLLMSCCLECLFWCYVFYSSYRLCFLCNIDSSHTHFHVKPDWLILMNCLIPSLSLNCTMDSSALIFMWYIFRLERFPNLIKHVPYFEYFIVSWFSIHAKVQVSA